MGKPVYAPISGRTITLEKTEDPAFSAKLLGDGYAIEPDSMAEVVYSPVNGRITVISEQNHALSILSSDGLDILLHIGIDTITLEGQGFNMLCKSGQTVRVGDPLVKVDFPYIKNYASGDTLFILITNTADNMTVQPTTNTLVKPKDLLFTVNYS